MKIFLLGYMGSGKSTIGKLLAADFNTDFIDLDHEIEKTEGVSISELFKKKGEIYFRKSERKLLEKILCENFDGIVSLGGGTPCYGDNLDLIKENKEATSVYLKMSVQKLTDRLFAEKDHRPLISHLEQKEQLEEFIRKHLFERGFYYNQSDLIINCDDKNPAEIVTEISDRLR